TGGTLGTFFTLWGGTTGEIYDGEIGDNAGVFGSEVRVYGGQLGKNYTVEFGGRAEVHGGEFGGLFFVAESGSVLVTGGNLGRQFTSAGTVDITGGEFGSNLLVRETGNVTISGGVFGDFLGVAGGGTVTLRGGTPGDFFQLNDGSQLDVVGSNFQIDGLPIDGLDDAGDQTIITDRGGVLTGTLLDGSPFDLSLSDVISPFNEYVHPNATLRLTMALEGDYNADGIVGTDDLSMYQSTFGTTVPAGTGADGNGDGVVNAADYTIWRDAFESVETTSIPEPMASVLAALALLLSRHRTPHRA
ncbi:MAG: hypothetical protein AAF266_10200, partial [Planctomycetota bacterium]